MGNANAKKTIPTTPNTTCNSRLRFISFLAFCPDMLAPQQYDTMPTVDNKNVITMFIEQVLNAGRLERMDDLVLEDFVELDPLPGQSQGREGLKDVVLQMRASFPDMHWVVHEMIAEADKVCTRFTWTGTQHGAFLGVPATGRHVTVKGVVIDRLVAGKMADSRILMDNLGMMQQLGAVPAH
jgi:steroid delta-isomerase-like uncharacterized protein